MLHIWAYLQPHSSANEGGKREIPFPCCAEWLSMKQYKGCEDFGTSYLKLHRSDLELSAFTSQEFKIRRRAPKEEKELQLQRETDMKITFKFKTVFAHCNKNVGMMNRLCLSHVYIYSQTLFKALFCWFLQF